MHLSPTGVATRKTPKKGCNPKNPDKPKKTVSGLHIFIIPWVFEEPKDLILKKNKFPRHESGIIGH